MGGIFKDIFPKRGYTSSQQMINGTNRGICKISSKESPRKHHNFIQQR